MQYNPRLIVAVASTVVAVAVAAKSCAHTVRVEQTKRKELEANMLLDTQAIHNASRVTHDRIERGEIRSLDQLRDSVQTEVAFQKIAIRED